MATILCSPWKPLTPTFGGQFGVMLIDYSLLPSVPGVLIGMVRTICAGVPTS